MPITAQYADTNVSKKIL